MLPTCAARHRTSASCEAVPELDLPFFRPQKANLLNTVALRQPYSERLVLYRVGPTSKKGSGCCRSDGAVAGAARLPSVGSTQEADELGANSRFCMMAGLLRCHL